MFAMQETIRPSADLRNHYKEISKQCREGKEAVIITVNGRGDTVSLSYEEYKNMKSRIGLLEVPAAAAAANYLRRRLCATWASKRTVTSSASSTTSARFP